MIQLSDVYMIESVNKYYKERSLPDRMLEGKHCGKFLNENVLKQRRTKLEYKLQPEQIVVSNKQAEKESLAFIEDHK
jgi:hypothetical protein